MDVKQVFERNAARLNALYAGQDQLPRYAALADDFRAHFGREPEMFVSAPGRTEVVGNHTDHQNGRVLAGAVNLDTVAAIAANGNRHLRCFAPSIPDILRDAWKSFFVAESCRKYN